MLLPKYASTNPEYMPSIWLSDDDLLTLTSLLHGMNDRRKRQGDGIDPVLHF